MRHNGFVAFILTHGRPDRVLTYEKLRKHGYTGKIYIVCDDEDKTLPEYRKRFGDVLVFSKSEIAKTFDEGDNFGDRRAIIYARNACFELARQIGATHFIELDDDYTYFKFRFDAQLRWHGADVQDLDAVFDMLLDYFNSAPMLTLAIGQGGDYIGGEKGDEIQRRNTADAQGHELVHLLRRPTVSIHRPYQRRRQYLRPAGVAGGGISVYPTNRPRPTRNAEQQRRYDGIILGRGHVCKEFLHGHVLSVMRGCFGNGNRPSAAASSHQMAVRRAEDTARIGKKSNDQWHHTQAITNRRKTAGMPVCRSCRICASNGGCRFVR